MSEPLVSIVVPTYNVERYVEECLDSIINQTYSNIEVIVIDDGSTDATPYLLKPYQNNVKLLLNDHNKGQGAVRNEGIEKALGKYLLFVDSDDWIERDTVEILVFEAEKTGADMIRFNGQSFLESASAFEQGVDYDFSSILEEQVVYEREELLKKNQKAYSASPCLYMMKKTLVDELAIRFPEGVLHEDEYFTTKLFISAQKMAYVNRAFYHRRYRAASTMTESTPLHKKKSFESYLEIFRLLEVAYQSKEYNDSQKSFIKRQMISIYSGLQKSQVDSNIKKQLRLVHSITAKDKARMFISRLRSVLKVSAFKRNEK